MQQDSTDNIKSYHFVWTESYFSEFLLSAFNKTIVSGY